MIRRQRLSVLAALALAGCPVLAAQPALDCAVLTPESFTPEQFSALESNAPVLHGYLATGTFHGLDARQRFRLVSEAFAGAGWNDISLPEPYYPRVTGSTAERDAMMGTYMGACSNALAALMDLPGVLAAGDTMLALTTPDALGWDRSDPRCGNIAMCHKEYQECLKRANAAKAQCIRDANTLLEADLEECEFQYDQNIQNGMNPTAAAVLLAGCNTDVQGDHVGRLGECVGDHVESVANCVVELAECVARHINPF